jgi:AcrR family transcriptional regulator
MPREPAPSAADGRTRSQRGRPRSARVERAVLEATLSLIVESGLDGATIGAIADRARVARATIYLRWPTRGAVIGAALRHAIGRPPFDLSGDLETDLRRGAEQVRSILAEPLFAMVLPVLVREFLAGGRAEVTFDALFPTRRRFAEAYDDLAGTQGFRMDVDGTLAADLLIGPFLSRFLATGDPPTTAERDAVIDVALECLRGAGRIGP